MTRNEIKTAVRHWHDTWNLSEAVDELSHIAGVREARIRGALYATGKLTLLEAQAVAVALGLELADLTEIMTVKAQKSLTVEVLPATIMASEHHP